MNCSGHRSLCVRRQWGQSQTSLNLKYKLPAPPTEDDCYQALCHGRGGSTGGIRGSQKKPQLRCLCEFPDSKIFSLDFSFKAVEVTLNASLTHAVGILGTLGSVRTIQGSQPHPLVVYPSRCDEYVTRDIGPWISVGLH